MSWLSGAAGYVRGKVRLGTAARHGRMRRRTGRLTDGRRPRLELLEDRRLLAVNLTPYTPSGWPDSIVISTETGTHTDASSIATTDTVYCDFAWINSGNTAAGAFRVNIYVDSILRTYYSISSMSASSYMMGPDVNLGSFGPGSHTVEMRIDETNTVAESVETDNNYSRTFTVTGTVSANLTPYQPSGWDDAIVVSTQSGTTTNDTLTTNDAIYIDWAVLNNGTAAAGAFSTHLYLDGYLLTAVDGSGLPANYYTYVQDWCLGTLKAGTYTLQLVTDATGAVAETDETDNTYSVSITVNPVNTAPVIRGLPDVQLDEDGQYPADGEIVSLAASDQEACDLSTSEVILAGSESGESDDTTVVCRLTDETGTMVSPSGFDGDLVADRTQLVNCSLLDDPSLDAMLLTDSLPSGTRYMVFDDWGGTWIDAEKDAQDGDNLMCWAATASNGLLWSDWGLVDGMTNADEIFQYFQDHWTDEGGAIWCGWNWWFNGENPGQGNPGTSQVDVPGGNFYPGLDPDEYIHRREGTTASQYAMLDIDEYLHAGYAVGLGLSGTIAHAVTCWGFNYNSSLLPTDPNYYTGVWITDSDDTKQGSEGSAAPDSLHYYAITWDSANLRYNIDSSYSAGTYLDEVVGLELMPQTGTDLWAYTRDGETDDSGLAFSIVGNTNPECGVSIVSNRYLSVSPDADWYGTSDVTVQVSDGEYTSTATFRITVNAVNDAPGVASLTADPNPVVQGESLVLAAEGVEDSADPDGFVTSVAFYRETNGIAGLQPEEDTLVGTDTTSEPWSLEIDTSSLTPGTYTFYAQAEDNEGAVSPDGTSAASITVEVTEATLSFAGTSGDDVFTVNQEATAGQVSVWLNETSLGTFTAGALQFLGQEGDDRVIVNARATDDAIGIGTAAIAVNEISVTGESIESWQINALEGNDTFTFLDAGTWQLTVSGGTGTDVLDYSAVAGPVEVNLQDRTASQLSRFTSIESFVGSSGTDTLIGPNAERTWNLTGLDTGTVGSTGFSSFENLTGGTGKDSFRLKSAAAAVSGQLDGGSGTDTLAGYNTANAWNLSGTGAGDLNSAIAFIGIENLTGGSGTDQFLFATAADGFGTINGSSGSDTLDYSAVTGPVTIDLQQKTASKLTSFSSIESFAGSSDTDTDTLIGSDGGRTWYLTGLDTGTVGGAGFSSFENLTGGSGNDSFRLKSATAGLSGELHGGGGTDTLVGPNTTNTWNLDGPQAGNLNGTLAFSGIKNLTGGSGTDHFVFANAADGFGTINGGSGSDTLDYSAVTGPVAVDLQQKTASKLTSFSSLESFVGSSASDRLTGTDANQTWYLTGLGAGIVGGKSFASFENLTGGSLNDSFHLNGSGELADSIDGGGGLNGLDYSFYGLPCVSVDLQTGTATAIGSGLSGVLLNLAVVVGTSGDDTLVGDDNANLLFGGAGNDLLQGGLGRDILFGGSGTDDLDGGAGEDILVAGITSYYSEATLSQNHSRTSLILAEWTRTDLDYAARIDHLLNGGGLNETYVLDATTVKQDAPAVDHLLGGADLDWFLVSSEDVVEAPEIPETVTVI